MPGKFITFYTTSAPDTSSGLDPESHHASWACILSSLLGPLSLEPETQISFILPSLHPHVSSVPLKRLSVTTHQLYQPPPSPHSDWRDTSSAGLQSLQPVTLLCSPPTHSDHWYQNLTLRPSHSSASSSSPHWLRHWLSREDFSPPCPGGLGWFTGGAVPQKSGLKLVFHILWDMPTYPTGKELYKGPGSRQKWPVAPR